MQSEEIIDVVIVGGGIAGLATGALLARGGRRVTLIEKSKQLGGMAVTGVHQGFYFNRGIHAFYQTGTGEEVLRELGVAYTGNPSDRHLYEAEYQGQFHSLPTTPELLRTTSMLSDADRLELTRVLGQFAQIDGQSLQGMSIAQLLDQMTTNVVVRRFMEAAVRLATYTNALELLDARFAHHLVSTLPDALHIDWGWQTIVDGLEQAARLAGVRIVTGMRVVAIEPESQCYQVCLADGRNLLANIVVLATEPAITVQLVMNGTHPLLRQWYEQMIPIYAACLDVGLRRLPFPRRTTVLSLDHPRFYSNHARQGKLAPEEGALLHLIKYIHPEQGSDAQADRQELEQWLDRLQPGWRELVVEQQFLPHIRVSNNMLQAVRGGLAGRPGPLVPDLKNLYVVGDWVGQSDHLANASLMSANQVAQYILMHEAHLR